MAKEYEPNITTTPNSKQRKALKGMIEGKSSGQAMIDAGYSKAYSTNVKQLTDSKSFKQLLAELAPDMKQKAVVETRGMLDNKEWQAKGKAIDIISKWYSLDAPKKSLNVQAKLDNKQVNEFLLGIE